MNLEISFTSREFAEIAECCPLARINERYEERWCKATDKECEKVDCPFVYWIENSIR